MHKKHVNESEIENNKNERNTDERSVGVLGDIVDFEAIGNLVSSESVRSIRN
jgi:hypothetical protein